MHYLISGNKKLHGEINIHGAKNSSLPILAAAFLCKGECVIHNCPNLCDCAAAMEILRHLGCLCYREDDTVVINAKNASGDEIPAELMREMRSSIVFLGAMIGRTGRARISYPGGCDLGPRPIDLHISAMKKLGVRIYEDHGFLECSAPDGLHGADIMLSFPSVGATENIILAACLARGTTRITNAAREPEIEDLAAFLNKAGAGIYGAGDSTVVICGRKGLDGTEHSVIPDRIVTATYMAAVGATGGDAVLRKIFPSHIAGIIPHFESTGMTVRVYGDVLSVSSPGRRLHSPGTVRTMPYPGFPTDASAPLLAMTTVCDGSTVVVENIFQSRFRYVTELSRMGADIRLEGNVAVVNGVKRLHSAEICACDLRGGAALTVAALAAEGQSRIDGLWHIDRGYEDFEGHLRCIGAEIVRLE